MAKYGRIIPGAEQKLSVFSRHLVATHTTMNVMHIKLPGIPLCTLLHFVFYLIWCCFELYSIDRLYMKYAAYGKFQQVFAQKFIYSEKATNFAKSPPYFWLAIHKVRWRFCNILWPSQNIWTLKFGFSEKATNFETIFHLIWCLLS